MLVRHQPLLKLNLWGLISFAVSMDNLEFSSEICKFNFVFVVSSVAFRPKIVLFALVSKHQQLLDQTPFALTRLLTSLCLILSTRLVLSDVLPHMCFSSFVCTCHIFSPFLPCFYFSQLWEVSVLRFFVWSSLAWCLFISKESGSYVYFCPYPCSSTYRRARLPTDRHRRHSYVKTNDIEFLGEWVRASRCTKHQNLVRPTS